MMDRLIAEARRQGGWDFCPECGQPMYFELTRANNWWIWWLTETGEQHAETEGHCPHCDADVSDRLVTRGEWAGQQRRMGWATEEVMMWYWEEGTWKWRAEPSVGGVGPYFTSGKQSWKCPVCNGTGKVSIPPEVAGDQPTFTHSSGGPWECRACRGAGIVWG